jgi:hypothetical protein
MQYFVVDLNTGQKYGPADIPTLNQWITEGRLLKESTLEDSMTGQRFMALQVNGLNFPQAPGPQSGGYVPPNYGAPQQGYQDYARPGAYGGDDGSKDLTMAYVFAGLSFLCCPLVFGGLGIWKAIEAKNKGNPGGQTALIVVIVVASLSFVIGIVLNPFARVFGD